MNKLSSLLLSLVAALVLVACMNYPAASSSSRSNPPVNEIPLARGTTWTYSYTEYEPTQADPTQTMKAVSEYTDTVVDTQTVGPYFIAHVKRTTRLIQADPGWIVAEGSGVPEWWYVAAGNKVYESRRPLDANNIQPDTLLFDFDFPLVVGKSWCIHKFAKGVEILDCSGAGKVSVDAVEPVDIPAGKFENCYQITQWSNGGNILQKFCSGVGIVAKKFDHAGTRFGFEQTLVNYSIGSSNKMTPFQLIALLLATVWLILVAARFRRSTLVLLIGLLVLGAFTLVEFWLGKVTPAELGLAIPGSWLTTLLFALGGLAVMLAYSPLADWLASRWFKKPPTLQAFGAIQRGWVSLAAGILVAWILGGVLEELVARGIVLNSIEALLSPALGVPLASVLAIVLAAMGAGVMHSYQGPRAMVIIAQLSILFGVLFVVSGHNLWAVMICHGLYDTIAFIRFALGKSRYSHPEGSEAG